MSFSPKCKDSQPALFLVKGFVEGSPISTPRVVPKGKAPPPLESLPPMRSIDQLPASALAKFHSTLKASLDKIVFRTNQTPPTAKAPSLFEVKEVEGIENVPAVLGAGDVVICFAFFPELYLVKTVDSDFESASLGKELLGMASGLFDRTRDKFLIEWNAAAGAKTPAPKIELSLEPEPDVAGLGGALVSPLSVTLSSGSKRQTYFAHRGGVVDAGTVAGIAANQVWTGTGTDFAKRKKAFMNELKTAAGDSESFGPLAIAKLRKESYPREYPQYLDAVGRGFAYLALHEFWHATNGRPPGFHVKDPSGGLDLGKIETPANPSFQRDLTLLDSSVADITKQYETVWCKFIGEGRNAITSLRR